MTSNVLLTHTTLALRLHAGSSQAHQLIMAGGLCTVVYRMYRHLPAQALMHAGCVTLCTTVYCVLYIACTDSAFTKLMAASLPGLRTEARQLATHSIANVANIQRYTVDGIDER